MLFKNQPGLKRRGTIFLLVICFSFLGTGLSTGVGNLIYNGNFEIPGSQNLPPGWAMWGAAVYQNPANYSLDSSNPYSGKFCLRIHHPAETNGYIVTSPNYALRPRKGKIYTITFYARTNNPGSSLFGFYAYENLKTFIDAPSPGFFPITIDRQWERYTFKIKEGLDFFADRSPFLLLTIKATTDFHEEKTLWIDEVSVMEEDYPQGMRLVDERMLPHESLQHRLQPGQSLSFTVDIENRLRAVNHMISGISLHRVAGYTGHPFNAQGQYTLSSALEQAIRDLRLPMTRFYGLGDEPFSLENAIDKAAEVCRRVGISPAQTILEFEPQNARYKLAPETWGQGVSHSVQKRYGFRYWEVANEPENGMLLAE